MITPGTTPHHFYLGHQFTDQLRGRVVPWGHGGLSEVTFRRTYSRGGEAWADCVVRVIEGQFTILKTHAQRTGIPWGEERGQRLAQEAAERMWAFKWTPPGRGLWMMGTDYVWERGGAALNNCAFVSTAGMDPGSAEETLRPFMFLMDVSMLGVGTGFDVAGAGKVGVRGADGAPVTHRVADSREGWVAAVGEVLRSVIFSGPPVQLDVQDVRPAGRPLRGFGGTASGPGPLLQGVAGLADVLGKRRGQAIDSTTIVDIMNLIGKVVVSGNIRRTAEIALAPPGDEEFTRLKNWSDHPVEVGASPPPELAQEGLEADYDRYLNGTPADRQEVAVRYADRPWAYKFGGWRWASNNSIFAEVGMDYHRYNAPIAEAGEPGFAWLDLMRQYGRMRDPANGRDHRVAGGNPCVTGDTLVAVADGRNAVPIRDLVGTQYPVYTVGAGGKVGIGRSVRTWLTRRNAEVWRLVLDDGSELRATPDHRVMMRGGEYRELRDLLPGDSLMPFNSRPRNKWYRGILGSSHYKQCHAIYEHKSGRVIPEGHDVHHVNGDKLDDRPENLELAEHGAHSRQHRSENNPMWDPAVVEKVAQTRAERGTGRGELNPMHGRRQTNDARRVIGEKSRRNWDQQRDKMQYAIRAGMTAEVRRAISAAASARRPRVLFVCPACGKEQMLPAAQAAKRFGCSMSCANRVRYWKRTGTWNHKVVSVEYWGREDVYDMEVAGTHNFGVITSAVDEKYTTSSGLFIHNCLEQSLEDGEMCNLVENYPAHAVDYWDFQRSLKFSYLYAKAVTLVGTHIERTNEVMVRNRRIGCSLSGVAEAVAKFGRTRFLQEWCERGYQYIGYLDTKYSDWLGVRESIKRTSIKPSGTVSLLAGVWGPGCHWPKRTGYRLMRLAAGSDAAGVLVAAGYRVEPAASDPTGTVVAYFPWLVPEGVQTDADVGLWEQVKMAADLQHWWADNQVSYTATFTRGEAERGEVGRVLEAFDGQLKGISLLPKEEGLYQQMPFTQAPRADVEAYAAALRPLEWAAGSRHEAEDKFCDGPACEVPVAA